MTTQEIARLLEAEVEGDNNREISGASTLEMATESQLAFVEGKGAGKDAAGSKAGCLLVAVEAPAMQERTLIRVPKPRNAFARVLRVLYPPVRPAPGVHPSAVVSESAVVGEGVSIGAHSVIGESVRIGSNTVVANGVSIGQGSTLGSDCWVHPGVVVYHGVSIGDRVILHAGCVLGADGFGYARENSHWEKFPQIGTVEIGNDVEIGAHSCVDRAALMVTVIGDGAKLDNMVHIGHNCCIGRHVVIAAQTGLSGGVIVEDDAVIGGQVGIGDKARIESRAVLGSGCGVLPSKVIRSGQTVWGTPARPRREYLERLALLGRLPSLAEDLKALAERVTKLESK